MRDDRRAPEAHGKFHRNRPKSRRQVPLLNTAAAMSWRRSVTALARTLAPPCPPSLARPFASTSSCSSSSSSSPAATRAPAASSTTVSRPELHAEHLRYLKSLSSADLAAFDPVLDVHPSKTFSPRLASPASKHAVQVTLLNDTPNNRGFTQPRPSPDLLDGLPGEDDSVSHLAQLTDLSPGEIRGLFRFPLVVKRVVTMKSKGKMPSMYSLVVVGNGRGLVGLGEGKDDTANKAVQKAFNQAVRSMDYVERYEDRTVSGTMKSNFGTCKIEMRSRPPGAFSLGELGHSSSSRSPGSAAPLARPQVSVSA